MTIIKSCAERIREGLALRGMRQSELAEKSGLDRSLISCYINGRYAPKSNNIYKIAKALNVSEAWLIGYDVDIDRVANTNDLKTPIYPVSRKTIPMLGSIACGEPKLANEEHEAMVAVGTDMDADFCLKANGDSMIGARIYDGDIVFVKSQEIVENGEIAVVVINDEATLKRAYWFEDQQILILRPENPAYKEMVFAKEDLCAVKIIGKAVAFQASL